MSNFAVLTPSYEQDFELCRDLNRSVLDLTAPDVHHHIIVPTRDRPVFASLDGPRTQLWTLDDFIPRRMVSVPRVGRRGSPVWLNVHRPYPPIRGWIMQQVVKLRAAAEIGADTVLIADSDAVVVRPVGPDTFSQDGRLVFYRSPNAIHEGMPQHVVWHNVARRLLGLSPGPVPLTDYISPFLVWDRAVLTALHDRIERVNGRPWMDVVASQLHVSECILYGVFVEDVLGDSANVCPTDATRVHQHWGDPLTPHSAREFVDGLRSDDLAVVIHAKTWTPLDVRRRAVSSTLAAIDAAA
jgi:hypothetical protein